MFKVIAQLFALFAPWKNETTAQKVGTICTAVAMLASIVAYLAGQAPTIVVPVIPDVPVMYPTQDVVPDPLPDVPPVPVDAPPVVGMSWQSFVPFVGCNPTQVAKWRAFKDDVFKCLVEKCHLSEDLVAAFQGGAFLNIALSELPNFMLCLGEGISGTVEREEVPEMTMVTKGILTFKAARVSAGDKVYRLRIKPPEK